MTRKTPTAIVAQAGRLLYGERWIAPLARDLAVATRTMERIAKAAGDGAEYPAARALVRDLPALLEGRGQLLEQLRRDALRLASAD